MNKSQTSNKGFINPKPKRHLAYLNHIYVENNPELFKIDCINSFIRYLPAAPGTDASNFLQFPKGAKKSALEFAIGRKGLPIDMLLRSMVPKLHLDYFQLSPKEIVENVIGMEYKLFINDFKKIYPKDTTIITYEKFIGYLQRWIKYKKVREDPRDRENKRDTSLSDHYRELLRFTKSIIMSDMIKVILLKPYLLVFNSLSINRVNLFVEKFIYPLNSQLGLATEAHVFGITKM